jgi:hypothetical protein
MTLVAIFNRSHHFNVITNDIFRVWERQNETMVMITRQFILLSLYDLIMIKKLFYSLLRWDKSSVFIYKKKALLITPNYISVKKTFPRNLN